METEGRLSLDDSVEEWLPGLIRGDGYDAEAITGRQLLNHTSGTANHTDDPEFIHRAAGPGFDATEQNMTRLGAAGDVISTAGDLHRSRRALVSGTLLPRAQMKPMFAEVPAGDGTGYGLGVEFAETSCGVKGVGESGRTKGSSRRWSARWTGGTSSRST
ncbi:serine hydrolase [Streptomyces koyangensis]|uniref:serine hydrolase n=1 Tax=Streptomyces koyangensis TaxID=188770 RepID=UPI003C2BB663